MKKIIFIYLLLPIWIYAQPITFDKVYYNGRNPYAVIPNSQGYALAGNSQTQDYWLCQTDFYGNILWEKTYGLHYGIVDAHFMGNTVMAKDGGYFLAGYTYSMPDSNWQKPYGYIVKTDSMGNKQWEKALHTTYDSTMMNYIYSIAATDDGGCIVVGKVILCYCDTYDSLPPKDGLYIVKLSSSGESVWEKIYGAVNDLGVYNISMEIGNQEYLIGGRDALGNTSSGLAMRINATGDSIWSLRYPQINTTNDTLYEFTTIEKLSDGNFMIGYGGGFLKVTPQGLVMWYKDLGGTRKIKRYGTDIYISHLNSMIGKFDEDGNEFWQKDIGTSIKDFAKTEDGGFVLLTTQGTSAIRLIKTDCEGNIINPIFCVTGVNPQTDLSNVSVYPNPTEDKVRIEATEIGNYQVQLIDIQGKCLQSSCIKNSNYAEVNTERLSQGVYILSIKNINTQQSYQTKLIKK